MAAIELPRSCHGQPDAARFVRDVRRDAPLSLTVYLDDQHEGFSRLRALGEFRNFARRHDLSMRGGPSRASIHLGGSHQNISRAFGTIAGGLVLQTRASKMRSSVLKMIETSPAGIRMLSIPGGPAVFSTIIFSRRYSAAISIIGIKCRRVARMAASSTACCAVETE